MHIYAISDLHLSFGTDKPMDVFGEQWRDHPARLSEAWRACVTADDLVLIPGDVSWAMQLSETAKDMAFLSALPGKKLLSRGNHDYWWGSLKQVRAALPPDISALRNDAFVFGGYAVCGARGWICPADPQFTAHDRTVYEHELWRLRLSLDAAPPDLPKIVMLHFPPFTGRLFDPGFSALLEEAAPAFVLYGHLHGAAHKNAFVGTRNGSEYRCVAADYLNFTPLLLV